MRLQLDVIVRRGEISESRHRVQAAVVDAGGRAVLETGDSALVTTFRSAAKPFQVLPLIERGHGERWKITDEELAVMCASHTGSDAHRNLVRGILERLSLPESALACGFHEPADPAALEAWRAHPNDRSPLYNNCSGKHAGMLCLALSEGWPTRGYERAGHPVQQLMKKTIAEVCSVAPESLRTAIDGCSVVVFALPLEAMARGYAKFAAAGGATGDDRQRALGRIRGAMMAYPLVTGGAGRFATELMKATAGRVVAKGGAEGLECAGVPGMQLGIAIKAEDGALRAVAPATMAVLDQLGVLSPSERATLDSFAHPPIPNAAGLDVGSLEVRVRSLAPSS